MLPGVPRKSLKFHEWLHSTPTRFRQFHPVFNTAVVTYIKEYRQTRDTTKFVDEDDTDVFKRGTKGWLLQFGKSSPVANAAVS